MLLKSCQIFVTSLDQVQTDTVESQLIDADQTVPHMAEVCLQKYPDIPFAALPGRKNGPVQVSEEVQVAVLLVKNQVGLIKLNPVGAKVGKTTDDVGIGLGQGRYQILSRFDSLPLGTTCQLEEGVGTNHHRLRGDSLVLRLLIFVERLRTRKLHMRISIDFRNQVMVVGRKPLFHGQGGRIALITLIATAHGKERILRAKTQIGVTAGHHIEQDGCVQHLVVVTEVIAGNQVYACFLLEIPVLGTQ